MAGKTTKLQSNVATCRKDHIHKLLHLHRHHQRHFTPRYVTMLQLTEEMRDQNLDAIRFSVYRTACKLRFIQRRSNRKSSLMCVFFKKDEIILVKIVILIDLWNVIESFREFHLSQVAVSRMVSLQQLGELLTGLFGDLNKRLPQQICVEYSASTVMSWLAATFDRNGSGVICLLAIKISLAVMSRAKLTDKLKYIFSLICTSQDPNAVWQPMNSPETSRKGGGSPRRRLDPIKFDQCARVFVKLAAALSPMNPSATCGITYVNPSNRFHHSSQQQPATATTNNDNSESVNANNDGAIPTEPGLLAKQVFGDPVSFYFQLEFYFCLRDC